MKVDAYALSAGVAHVFQTPARFLMLVSTAAPITVRFRRNGSRTWEVATDVETGYISEPGNWSNPDDRFDAFELQSATNQTVRVGISDRKGDYRSFTQSVSITQSNGLTTVADVAVDNTAGGVQLAAANSNRKKIILQNVGAANVRVGDASNVAAGRGIRLTPGASMTLDTTAAINAIREGATDSTVAVLEEVET